MQDGWNGERSSSTAIGVYCIWQSERLVNVLIHLILSSLVLSAPAQAGEVNQVDQALVTEVRQWVRQLDNNQLAQRQAAENALITLGPSILRHLPDPGKVTSSEVRQRLERVIKTLQLQESRHATAASQVDLKGLMDFSAALKALEEQTGNRFKVRQLPVARVRLDYQQVSFWEALDGILDQVKWNVDPYLGGRALLGLTARPEEERARRLAASYAGIFRFEPLRVEASRHLRNPRIRGLKVAMQVAWEPRVTPVFLSVPAAQLSARDERGKPLAIDDLGGVISAAIEGEMTAVELVLPLQLPKRDVQRIASLKGQLVTLMPGRAERFEFSRFQEKNQVQKKAGVTVVLQQVTRDSQDLTVQVKVAYERADQAFESHRGWVFANPAFLQSADGKVARFRSYETLDQGARSVTLAYHFKDQDGLQNPRFVYETPAVMVRKLENFQLLDIPLP